MKILLTGGGGILGSTLLSYLMHEHRIIVLDSGRTYALLHPIINENVTLIKGHVFDRKIVKESMKEVDIVIHLKGGGGNKLCLADPAKAVKIHIIGTNYLVEEAIRSKVSLFIYGKLSALEKILLPGFDILSIELITGLPELYFK